MIESIRLLNDDGTTTDIDVSVLNASYSIRDALTTLTVQPAPLLRFIRGAEISGSFNPSLDLPSAWGKNWAVWKDLLHQLLNVTGFAWHIRLADNGNTIVEPVTLPPFADRHALAPVVNEVLEAWKKEQGRA